LRDPDDQGSCAVMYFDGEWRILFGDDDAEAEYGPTHWMPLPEPPTE
jgi:Protein of unknown function (DUF551)